LIKRVSKNAFSLIELLVILTIFSIMLLIAISYGCELVGKNRAQAYVDKLRAALLFTRASAISFGEPVMLCGSKNHDKCGDSWQDDLIVITHSGKLLRVLPKAFSGDELKWFSSRGINDRVIFLPMGFTDGEQNGSFYYCPKNHPENGLRLILVPSGRPNISRTTCLLHRRL